MTEADTKTLTPAEALRRGADLIEQVGLWQGGCLDSDIEKHCAVTALGAVCGDEYDPTETSTVARRALARSLGFPTDKAGLVFEWNDRAAYPSIVTDAMRRAAEQEG